MKMINNDSEEITTTKRSANSTVQQLERRNHSFISIVYKPFKRSSSRLWGSLIALLFQVSWIITVYVKGERAEGA